MQIMFLSLIYLIFLLSGAAALIYQVVWVRYLSLVFGGSHLAVTTVLAVFMGGLALGGYLIGKKAGNYTKLLRLYGFLELGIAFFALVFAGLMWLYPSIYIPLAQVAVTSPVYLSSIRIAFAVIALIAPTTLMGGTLPVLSSFVSHRVRGLGRHLSFLYAVNTLGAVIGAGLAGFIFLRYYSASTTLMIAVLINLSIGILSIALQDKVQAVLDSADPDNAEEPVADDFRPSGAALEKAGTLLSLRLVLWGIGVSGFCALGYEILWTRILSIVIGASVYGFTLMLMAFLTGISLGSAAYGLFLKLFDAARPGDGVRAGRSIFGFGLVQVIIGLSALLVTLYIRELPSHAYLLLKYFQLKEVGDFEARQSASLVLAFSYLFVPAFFMGVAFPLAGKIHVEARKVVGRSVGEILAYNTIGAILGSVVSGFVLSYLLGIERSLQLLALINIGFGLLVVGSLRNSKALNWGISVAVAALILVLAVNPDIWRMWDAKFLAIYQTNRPDKFSSAQKVRDALASYDVLYYGEGVQAIVSSIKSKDGVQSFLTNGRIEATNSNRDMQCQYTLGHLPMLLCKNPKEVFVLGTGSGMTLGATSVYPSVERITLAELEPKVLGVARTFAQYNHNVLDNPKLRIVLNDGRNFLMTTREKFDVITADPIHPWFSGAGYLYSNEYFKLAAAHLNPGGVICQWLPIYELTDDNLKSVVATFSKNFKHTMVWLSYIDAELVGSNSPIVIDEAQLEQRIRQPEVLRDLQQVQMGSAEALLSYFVMGNRGMAAFSRDGIVNTDDNLYLEFSAPLSIGNTALLGANYYNISRYRESILPYLQAPAGAAQAGQKKEWDENLAMAPAVDEVHAMELAGRLDLADYEKAIAYFDARTPAYAPWRFLKDEFTLRIAQQPRLFRKSDFMLVGQGGEVIQDRISALVRKISKEMTIIEFKSDSFRVTLGYLQVLGAGREAQVAGVVDDVMKSIRETYDKESKGALARGEAAPPAALLLPGIKELIASNAARSSQIRSR